MGRAQWVAKAMRAIKRLQWVRGLRAGVAVAGAMLVCRMLHRPMGWAALGGFEVILVDNGGPYRSRLGTMATLLVGGSVAGVVGAMAGGALLPAVLVTVVFCFAATFARVASEWIASTSVIILVIYFAGYGGDTHTPGNALLASGQFALGGLWAAMLSLVLWPFDPFRPARLAVAECYRLLARFTAQMPMREEPALDALGGIREPTSEFQRAMRLQLEAARRALGGTPARVTARTVRARNLAVLLETADMLFVITLRWRELAETARDATGDDEAAGLAEVREAVVWLSGAERAIHVGLAQRPEDAAASYQPEGSHSIEHVRPRLSKLQAGAGQAPSTGTLAAQLWTDEREALEDVQIGFEAVRSIWTGVELRGSAAARGPTRQAAKVDRDSDGSRVSSQVSSQDSSQDKGQDKGRDRIREDGMRWLDAVRANWTSSSVMMRHALRMGVVAGVDVLLMRLFRVQHGYWMAMTSIIVLQPYRSGTARRGIERVGGTIAGGMLAAVLAVTIHGSLGLIAAVTVTSMLTLATYAVNYAWYSFFLTPTFVLLSLPYLRDWRFAGVRMETTVVGALVAVLAMRLLWPEREHLELSRLLGVGAKADAGLLRAVVRYWRRNAPQTASAEASAATTETAAAVALARRLSGLAINDAEEALDRMLLEPGYGRHAGADDVHTEALTFVTYLRRLMRTATTLSVVGGGGEPMIARAERVASRLEALEATLAKDGEHAAADVSACAVSADGLACAPTDTLEAQQMRRMERQAGVLERAAAALRQKTALPPKAMPHRETTAGA